MNNGNFRNAWITRHLLLLSLPFCTPGLPVQDLLDHFREDEGTRGRSSQRWECSNGCLPPRHIVSAQYGCSDKAGPLETVNFFYLFFKTFSTGLLFVRGVDMSALWSAIRVAFSMFRMSCKPREMLIRREVNPDLAQST